MGVDFFAYHRLPRNYGIWTKRDSTCLQPHSEMSMWSGIDKKDHRLVNSFSFARRLPVLSTFSWFYNFSLGFEDFVYQKSIDPYWFLVDEVTGTCPSHVGNATATLPIENMWFPLRKLSQPRQGYDGDASGAGKWRRPHFNLFHRDDREMKETSETSV